MDRISRTARSALMRNVRGRDTTPEIRVRKLLHRLGYRFRLHRKDLPGSPDIVFGPRKKVIFIHGCFWHGHDCGKGRIPKSNVAFWCDKVDKNRKRDARNETKLHEDGWTTLIVWQCELKEESALIERLHDFLTGKSDGPIDNPNRGGYSRDSTVPRGDEA